MARRKDMTAITALFALIAVSMSGCLALQSSSDANSHSRLVAATWFDAASKDQQSLLEDEIITADEYGQALNAGRRCMEDKGFHVSPLQDLPDRIRRDFIVYAGTRSDDDVTPEWQRCRDQHYGVVEGIWLLQHVRQDTSKVEEELLRCLAGNSITGATIGMADSDLVQLLYQRAASEQAWTCREVFLITSGNLQPLPPGGPP